MAEALEAGNEVPLLALRPGDDDLHRASDDELGGERLGVGPGAALDPGTVLGRDQGRQDGPVVVRGDGCEAAAADQGDAATLGVDPRMRLGVVDPRDELLLTRADLERESALPRLRQHHGGVDPEPDFGVEP